MKFSKATGCFYPDEIEYAELPSDVIDVTPDEFAAAMNRTISQGLDVAGGHVVVVDLPAPSSAQLEAQAEATAGQAVKAMLDALAQSWQYSSYESARTYKGDSNPQFDAEGTALANYGSACYAYLGQIKAGSVPRPADTAALLAALPTAPTRPAVSA